MATNYNPSIVTEGLVLCLDGANVKSYPGSGTTWTDISGEGHDGTLTNGPTFSSNYGGNIVLDGSNDFVTGVHNSELNLRNDVTVECWFRRTGGRSTWVRIFGKGNSRIEHMVCGITLIQIISYIKDTDLQVLMFCLLYLSY